MIASTQTNHPLGNQKLPVPSSSPVELACTKLKAAGLRITQPRMAILAALIARGHPTSIEDIHADLDANACDLVTVYRCMAAFEEIGLVRRAFLINGTSLYDINLGDPARYHVVCKETNRFQEIDAETAAELRRALHKVEEVLHAQGYLNIGHIVEFFGVSPATPVAAEIAPLTIPAR